MHPIPQVGSHLHEGHRMASVLRPRCARQGSGNRETTRSTSQGGLVEVTRNFGVSPWEEYHPSVTLSSFCAAVKCLPTLHPVISLIGTLAVRFTCPSSAGAATQRPVVGSRLEAWPRLTVGAVSGHALTSLASSVCRVGPPGSPRCHSVQPSRPLTFVAAAAAASGES